ncbi:MAG: DMT family transporter [Hyphomicrobiales bacterium]|nr:DMT family transporter [Hyphomicrobiales bacterium]
MSFDRLILRLAPVAFVLIWSTGWISAGYSAPYADPLTFLTVRFSCAAVLLALLAFATGAPWPKGARSWGHAFLAGALLHGIYLAGVWWAVRHGLPAGISGLLAALQPILTAAFSPWLLGERISPIRWTGIAIGFAGIALVLLPKLVGLSTDILWLALVPILVNLVGMFAVTFGSFYQKRFQQSGDLTTMTAVQYLGAIAVTLPLAAALEPMVITWNLTMVFVLAWSVVGLSLGGIALFLLLIRRGEVSRAATFIYLVPPTVAIEAYFLFGEQLAAIQIIGMVVAVFGVVLASRK